MRFTAANLLLLTAATYNLAFAAILIADPSLGSSFLDASFLKPQMMLRMMMPVIAMGLVYLCGHLLQAGIFEILFIGLLTKLVPPCLAGLAVLLRDASPNWLILVGINDVIWWYAFVHVMAAQIGASGTFTGKLKAIFRVSLDNPILNAFSAIALTSVLGVSMTLLSVETAKSYGTTVFLTSPFTLSLFTVLLYCLGGRRNLAECLAVSMIPSFVTLVFLLLMAVEGIFCIVLVIPLMFLMNILGGLLGYGIQSLAVSRSKAFLCSIVLLNPLLIGAESTQEHRFPVESVVTEIPVDSDAHAIWRVFDQPIELASETAWLERFGFAVPRTAALVRNGSAKMLHCTFKRGYADFPVDREVEDSVLSFTPLENTPSPMEETGIADQIEAPHLDGYFVVHRGEISLTRDTSGGTILRARTEYVHRIAPSRYWRIWTSSIIDQLHRAVLRSIAKKARAKDSAN